MKKLFKLSLITLASCIYFSNALSIPNIPHPQLTSERTIDQPVADPVDDIEEKLAENALITSTLQTEIKPSKDQTLIDGQINSLLRAVHQPTDNISRIVALVLIRMLPHDFETQKRLYPEVRARLEGREKDINKQNLRHELYLIQRLVNIMLTLPPEKLKQIIETTQNKVDRLVRDPFGPEVLPLMIAALHIESRGEDLANQWVSSIPLQTSSDETYNLFAKDILLSMPDQEFTTFVKRWRELGLGEMHCSIDDLKEIIDVIRKVSHDQWKLACDRFKDLHIEGIGDRGRVRIAEAISKLSKSDWVLLSTKLNASNHPITGQSDDFINSIPRILRSPPKHPVVDIRNKSATSTSFEGVTTNGPSSPVMAAASSPQPLIQLPQATISMPKFKAFDIRGRKFGSATSPKETTVIESDEMKILKTLIAMPNTPGRATPSLKKNNHTYYLSNFKCPDSLSLQGMLISMDQLKHRGYPMQIMGYNPCEGNGESSQETCVVWSPDPTFNKVETIVNLIEDMVGDLVSVSVPPLPGNATLACTYSRMDHTPSNGIPPTLSVLLKTPKKPCEFTKSNGTLSCLSSIKDLPSA